MSVLSSVHQFVRPCISPFVRASVRLSVRSAVRLSVRLFDRRSAMLPLWHVRHLVTSDSVDCRSASTVGQRQLSDRVDCRTVRHSDGPTNTNFHQMADTRRSDSTCRSVGRSDGEQLAFRPDGLTYEVYSAWFSLRQRIPRQRRVVVIVQRVVGVVGGRSGSLRSTNFATTLGTNPTGL